MIRVLFVDDEMIVRVALKSMVAWEQTEFEIVGAVADGRAALEAVEREHPQIVVTDLKMPGLDGLGLCRELSQRGFDGKIVVLSSYGEFDLAREAMRYGVVDYLLKANFTDAELLAALRKAAAALPDETALPPGAPPGAVRFERGEIFCMLHRAGNQPEPRDYALPYRALYVLRRDHFLQGFSLRGPEEHTSKEMLCGVIGECIGASAAAQVIALTENEAVLFYPAPDAQRTARDAQADLGKISAALQIYMNTQAAFVLSEPFESSVQLQLYLTQCAEAARLTLYRGFGGLLLQQEARAYTAALPDGALRTVERVCEALTMSDYARAQELCFTALDRFDREHVAVKEARRFISALFEQITVAYAFYFENNKERLSSFALRYKECACVAEYKAVLADIIDEISVSLVKLDEGKLSKNVTDIIAYVKAHIDHKITLAQLSRAVSMSESYISRLFKNETGSNLMSYINMLKMERAMELLKSPDIFVKEAARQLGYDDQSYFNRIFNKYFGISPLEFKRNYQNSMNPGKYNPNPDR